MPSSNPARRFADIAREIDLILSFAAERSQPEIQVDLKTLRAIERCFQIISEAAVKLADDAVRLCPGHDWDKIRSFGNVLRHEYDNVEFDVLWATIGDGRLSRLRDDCLTAIATLSAPRHPV
jgi:uncharacterized protein with HEPN domain